MSSNNDNAMTRFLFAILKQKNLKDIDWNQVAHDPILTQEITNGHAARMRYSRFRAAMLGLEPVRRTRTGPNKSRVTKSKKNAKSRKDDGVKSETSTTPESPPAASPQFRHPLPTIQQRIKQENTPPNYNNRMTPAPTPGPVPVPPIPTPNKTMIQNRFLTPCSDTDGFSSSPVATSSPVAEILHSQNPFDFPAAPCHDHVDPAWLQGNSYFAAAFPYEDCTSSPCDHQHLQHIHSQYQLGLPNQSIETEIEQTEFKREWSQYD
ncbi:hypothetical protein EV127DRAFT_37138 [Xylaria flabelliformis]|nr:hypothetical protein EV127DRAFT_37138 [Xylaria flabelliformis]